MKTILLPLLALCFTLTTFAQSERKTFSKEEVLKDLDFLYQALEDAHFNIYAYTTKDELDAIYSSIASSVTKDSLDYIEATNLLQPLATAIKNGHTEVEFPTEAYIKYAYGGGTLFPLEVALENNKALIRNNHSDQDIPHGAQLMSINGTAMTEIIEVIAPHIPAERPYFMNAKIEYLTLPRAYWQLFGPQDEFTVDVKDGDQVRSYTLKAIKALDDFEMKRRDIIDESRFLKYYGNTAYLHPGKFGGDLPKYKKFIDSAFADMKAKNSKKLIIDLRNHGGGDDPFGDHIVSYFADKPFKWNSEFTLKTSQFLKDHTRKHYDTTETYWKEVLNRKNGEIYDYAFEEQQPQPEGKRFKGEVYVLVNRQSYSQSTVTAAQIQDYGWATIVGEETGEYPTLYASIYNFSLPHTGIKVRVSKGRIVRVNGSTAEEGVMPDILIKDHLLDEKDEILEGLLEKIR
ncbi:peptidase S41 [Robertkochia sp. 1368]|nr:peptidase S41 [Robertkochia sediminum]